jgi:hypothetical protein
LLEFPASIKDQDVSESLDKEETPTKADSSRDRVETDSKTSSRISYSSSAPASNLARDL